MTVNIPEVEMMKVISQFALTKGVVDENEVKANIPQYADLAPTAICEQEGATTDIEKAYIAARTMLNGGGTAGAPADPTKTTAVSTAPTQQMSAEEANGIISLVRKQEDERVAVSVNTTIEKLLLHTPDPVTYIKKGTMGTIKKETWDAIEAKYSNVVQPDDADLPSQKNFAELKAAAANGTPVEVHIPKLNDKVYGYLVKKGSATGKGTEETQETREEFAAFVALDAFGYVLQAGPNKPGVQLKYIEERPDKKNPGKQIPAKWTLSDKNKKESIAAGSFDTLKTVTTNMKEQNAKSELAFKVDSGKPRTNGSGNIIRTVRVTVQATLPELEIKDEYVEKFGSVGAGRNSTLEVPPTGDALNAIQTAQLLAISELRQKAANPTTMASMQQYADRLKAFEDVQGAPVNNNVVI